MASNTKFLTVPGVPGQWTPLSVWLLKLGVKVIHSRPYHPQGRGKNERFHRTLKAEVFAFNRFSSQAAVQKAFNAWRQICIQQRPHQAIGMNVPASRYRPSRRSMPPTLKEPCYQPGEITRRVGNPTARISFKNKFWRVPKAFAGEHVVLRPRGRDGFYAICFGATQIATFDLNTEEGLANL